MFGAGHRASVITLLVSPTSLLHLKFGNTKDLYIRQTINNPQNLRQQLLITKAHAANHHRVIMTLGLAQIHTLRAIQIRHEIEERGDLQAREDSVEKIHGAKVIAPVIESC